MNFLPQDPMPPLAPPPTSPDLLDQLQALTWVDHTALGVLLVFFVIGLFKGLIWQVSRIAILVVAYVVAGRFGGDVAAWLAGPPEPGVADPAAATSNTTIYLAYVLLFVAVLVVLSLVAMLLQKLAAKAGLGFFDRLGGGVLGVATGACVVLFGLFVLNMFFGSSQLAIAAQDSRSMQWSARAIDFLGDRVPDNLRAVFDLPPLHAPATGLGLPSGPGPTGPVVPVDANAPKPPAPGEPPPPPTTPPGNAPVPPRK